jgi:hypothetical protein
MTATLMVLAGGVAFADATVPPATAYPTPVLHVTVAHATPTAAELRAATDRWCAGRDGVPQYYEEARDRTQRRVCADLRRALDDGKMLEVVVDEDAPENFSWHVTDTADEATEWWPRLVRFRHHWRITRVAVVEDCTGP